MTLHESKHPGYSDLGRLHQHFISDVSPFQPPESGRRPVGAGTEGSGSANDGAPFPDPSGFAGLAGLGAPPEAGTGAGNGAGSSGLGSGGGSTGAGGVQDTPAGTGFPRVHDTGRPSGEGSSTPGAPSPPSGPAGSSAPAGPRGVIPTDGRGEQSAQTAQASRVSPTGRLGHTAQRGQDGQSGPPGTWNAGGPVNGAPRPPMISMPPMPPMPPAPSAVPPAPASTSGRGPAVTAPPPADGGTDATGATGATGAASPHIVSPTASHTGSPTASRLGSPTASQTGAPTAPPAVSPAAASATGGGVAQRQPRGTLYKHADLGPVRGPEDGADAAAEGTGDDCFDRLARLAEPESWTGPAGSPASTRSGRTRLLRQYIETAFERLHERRQVPTGPGGAHSVFNTGLVTVQQEPVYGLFVPNSDPDGPPWQLHGWHVEGDRQLLDHFPELPPAATYADSPGDLIFDWRCPLNVAVKHLLEAKDNLAALPGPLRSNPYQARLVLEGAVKRAEARARRNPRTAVACWNPEAERVELLLPLSLTTPDSADVALAVAREGDGYHGRSMLDLGTAYARARQIARSDDWLDPR